MIEKHGVKELRELLVAVAALAHSFIEANADNKITKLELLKILWNNLVNLSEGFGGINQVLEELRDLSPEEMEFEIYPAVMAELRWQNNQVSKNTFDDLFAWLKGTLVTFLSIKNTHYPKKAEVVPEN